MENHSINRILWLYFVVALHVVLIATINYFSIQVLVETWGGIKESWGTMALLFLSVFLVSGALLYDIFISVRNENTGTVFRAKRVNDHYFLIQKRHSLVPFWSSYDEVFTSRVHAEERARSLASNPPRM